MRWLLFFIACGLTGCATTALHKQEKRPSVFLVGAAPRRVVLYCDGEPTYATDYVDGPMLLVAPRDCEDPSLEITK